MVVVGQGGTALGGRPGEAVVRYGRLANRTIDRSDKMRGRAALSGREQQLYEPTVIKKMTPTVT